MDLNKHIYKSSDSRVFHSNGYAAVENNNSFGSTSNVPFEQRRQIDQNRKAVPGYRNSSLGNSYSQARVNPTTGNVDSRTRTLSRSQVQQLKQSRILSKSQIQQLQQTQQRSNNFIVPSRQFQEPISRPYNPYK